MGVTAIRADIAKRLQVQDAETRAWAAQLPANRKAECQAISPKTLFSDMPEDCVKLFFSNDKLAVPSGLENQIGDPPTPMAQAMTNAASLAVVPPVLLLVLGFAVVWTISGFHADVPAKNRKPSDIS